LTFDIVSEHRAQCRGKHSFDSKAAAVMVAKKLGVNVYRCNFCDGWHIGGGKPTRRIPGRRR
jgi:hypothetical protein